LAGVDPKARYSYAAKVSVVVNIPFPVAANMSWDSFWRLAYDKANALLQNQANELLKRGNVTFEEARQLVEVQRNGLIVEMRKPLTPFGKLYSEALKPVAKLPTLPTMVAKKGTVEAVLMSVGKTRAVTNRIAFVGRTAGPAGIVLEIVMVGVVIEKAPADERGRVAAEEIGGAAVGLAGGTWGMWAGGVAGAAWAGTWAAPTLVIPVVGEITEGSAILLGGIIGGLYFGWLSHNAGRAVGHELWRLASVQWK
jgi:hypothetical protein